MEFLDLTNEIYHGHEQEYTPVIPALTMTDSSSSFPSAWLDTSQSSLATTNCKPLPLPYPRKKNDELDYSIRTQMNAFAQYMNNEYDMESHNTSHITPYQSPKPHASTHIHSHAITIKRHKKTKHVRNNNPFAQAYDRDQLSLNTKSISDKFVAINGSSQGAMNEDMMRSNDINHYLSSSRSVSSFKLTDDAMEFEEGGTKYLNLADLSIDEYEEYAANQSDDDADNEYFIANRDAILKQYVECSDKVKGRENMIALYLCRWREEEAQNIAKIAYCFNGISDGKINKKKKKMKVKSKSRCRMKGKSRGKTKPKGKSKSSTQSKVRKSRKKEKTNNVIKPLHHKRLLHQKKEKKKHVKRNKARHDSTGVLVRKKRRKRKTNSTDLPSRVFTFDIEREDPHRVHVGHKSHSKSLKTIYDRNKSMDLMDDHHIFKTPSASALFGGLKHERNQTMPYSSRQYHRLQQKTNLKVEDESFDALSYSLSPTPEPPSHAALARINAMNDSMHYVMHTQMSSRTNTFHNSTNASSSTNTFHNSQYIPQPRASVVEKTFSWSDNESSAYHNMRIMKPQCI